MPVALPQEQVGSTDRQSGAVVSTIEHAEVVPALACVPSSEAVVSTIEHAEVVPALACVPLSGAVVSTMEHAEVVPALACVPLSGAVVSTMEHAEVVPALACVPSSGAGESDEVTSAASLFESARGNLSPGQAHRLAWSMWGSLTRPGRQEASMLLIESGAFDPCTLKGGLALDVSLYHAAALGQQPLALKAAMNEPAGLAALRSAIEHPVNGCTPIHLAALGSSGGALQWFLNCKHVLDADLSRPVAANVDCRRSLRAAVTNVNSFPPDLQVGELSASGSSHSMEMGTQEEAREDLQRTPGISKEWHAKRRPKRNPQQSIRPGYCEIMELHPLSKQALGTPLSILLWNATPFGGSASALKKLARRVERCMSGLVFACIVQSTVSRYHVMRTSGETMKKHVRTDSLAKHTLIELLSRGACIYPIYSES